MFIPKRFSILGLLIVALFIAGCGSDEPYQLAPVSGKITKENGDPMPNVTVTFQPTTEGTNTPGPGSFGKTDDQGRYTLELTTDGKKGAVVGKHSVSITTIEPEGSENSDLNDFKDPIPKRYNAETTITFDVPTDGSETANFKVELKKKSRK